MNQGLGASEMSVNRQWAAVCGCVGKLWGRRPLVDMSQAAPAQARGLAPWDVSPVFSWKSSAWSKCSEKRTQYRDEWSLEGIPTLENHSQAWKTRPRDVSRADDGKFIQKTALRKETWGKKKKNLWKQMQKWISSIIVLHFFFSSYGWTGKPTATQNQNHRQEKTLSK